MPRPLMVEEFQFYSARSLMTISDARVMTPRLIGGAESAEVPPRRFAARSCGPVSWFLPAERKPTAALRRCTRVRAPLARAESHERGEDVPVAAATASA